MFVLLQVGVNDMCPLKSGAYSVCDYELDGLSGLCCTRGDVAVGA